MAASGLADTALRDVALFRDLGDSELTTLTQEVTTRRYDRHELIFSQGDPGDGLYILAEGHVSISRSGPDGDELIITMMEPGQYFGELALFDDEPRSATATAVDPVTALFLARPVFRSFLEGHPKALLACLDVVVRELRHCTDLVDELALLDVRTRLSRRLLWLANQGVVRDESAGESSRHTLRITQQHLASMTGATRESVNKHLNSLVDEGIIRLERGSIAILDRERLEESSFGAIVGKM